ncbi:MAG: hypothetical protein ACLVEJ_12905 [Parabacteroides sp.]
MVINSSDLEFLWDEGRRDRMSVSSALALKMDVNLQFKKYDIAKEAAKKLMDSGKFELYYSTSTDDDPGKNYRDLFRYIGEQNKERIMFQVQWGEIIFGSVILARTPTWRARGVSALF